jgi:hypothetical protein
MNEVKVLSKEIIPVFIEFLNEGKSVGFKVSGHSMLPFFKHQKTIVTLSRKEIYEKYDVILYSSYGLYKLHRITKVKEDHFIVYGDALKDKEIIYHKDVIGYVEYHTNTVRKIHYKNRWYIFKLKIWILLKPLRRFLIKGLRKVKII